MNDPVNTKLPSYEVHHAGAERMLREIGTMLKASMPPNFGFSLFIFEYGEDGAMFWLSSAQRDTMLETLKEFIAKQEQEKAK